MGNKHSTKKKPLISKTKETLVPKTKNITPLTLITENISTCYISILPKEVVAIIMSYLLNNSLSNLVIACPGLRPCFNDEIEQRIVTLNSNGSNLGGFHDAGCESFERRMEKTIKKPQVILKIKDLEKSQSDDTCSRNAWVMNDSLELPDETCANFDIIVVDFTDHRDFEPSDSFLKKFSSLNSILFNLVGMDTIVPMLSEFPLLEFLSLYHCHFSISDYLSTIFDYCATLKEFHMNSDSDRMDINLIIPQQLETLELTSNTEINLNLDNSQLQSLSINSKDKVTIRAIRRLVSLKKVKLDCSRNLRIQGNVENLFINVKELSITLLGCNTPFGTFEDCSKKVPEITSGIYYLSFLMIRDIEKLRVVTDKDRDTIFCAVPSGNGDITVEHICVQNGKHMKSKHNLNIWPIVVKYSPGKELTEMEYTPSQWPINIPVYDALLRLNK